jgi:hypothetical protein
MKTFSRIIFLFLLVILFSCQAKSSQNPKDYSDSLLVLPGATNILYAKANQCDQVTYNLSIDYPAPSVTDQLLKTLSDKGWSPLKEDYLNPGLPTSFVRGWSSYEDMTKKPTSIVYSWKTDWQNAKGDVLVYAMKYSYPANSKPDKSNLGVAVIFVEAKIAQEMKRASLEILSKSNKKQGDEKQNRN